MLSIHGVHEWKVVPGLQDTGGQNVFVNQFSSALEKSGFKITIVNRGGYKHLRTGKVQTGLHYKDSHQRILYIEDGWEHFVRKEDMGDQFPELVVALSEYLSTEGSPVNLIISHYWDAGMLGCLLQREMGNGIQHVWVPHSLGVVKKRNVASQVWESLRIENRIEYEDKITQQIDFIAATSSIIRDSAKNDYGYKGKFLWLPPCVDQERYYPRRVKKSDPIWSLLGELVNLPEDEIQSRKIITEISRTDKTKQKDVLIKSFAQILENHPDSLLVVSIDDTNSELAEELKTLIHSCGINHSTAVVGSIWEALPTIYAISDIYCTPSIMEGFGMSVQEAAATKVPVISSDLVPFVTEYLAGGASSNITTESGSVIRVGEGALIISPGDIEGFSSAMDLLLKDDLLRKEIGENAYRATVPYFTWEHIVKDFLNELNLQKKVGQ